MDLVNQVQQDKKDGDVDIKVRISPNNYEEEFKVDTKIYDGPPKGYAYFLRDFIKYEGNHIRHFQVVAHGKNGGILIDLTGYGTNVKVKIKTAVDEIRVKVPKNESAPTNMIILDVNNQVYTESQFGPIKKKYENMEYGDEVEFDGGNIKGGDFLRVDCFALALEVIARKLGARILKIDGEYIHPGQLPEDQAKDNENARAFNSLIEQGTSHSRIRPKETRPYQP